MAAPSVSGSPGTSMPLTPSITASPWPAIREATARVELVDDRLDQRALEALADDLETQRPTEASTGDVGSAYQGVVALDGRQATHRGDEGLGLLGDPAGGVAGIDTVGDDPYPPGIQPELVHQLALGRLRHGDDGRPPVEGRRHLSLEQRAQGPEAGTEGHLPHLGVDVVDDDDTRPPVPQGAEERHAVPDLDQHVAGPGTAEQLGGGSTGKHHVAAGPPHDPVAIADGLGGLALSPGGAESDFEAGCRPATGGLVDVDLRPPGLHVVEVAPREHVDATDARRCRQVADLGDRGSVWLDGLLHGVVQPSSVSPANVTKPCTLVRRPVT